ncbi:MAG: type IV pilus modification PilV family protein [Pseudomonadota bacterium]
MLKVTEMPFASASAFESSIPGKQAGAVLLEALVAILVFSFGVLAIVGLQASSIKSSSDAKYRADAAFLANQILGMMWADARANLSSYAHRSSGANCNFNGGSGNANVISWLGTAADPGTVVGSLPGATTDNQQITVDAATGLVTVTICWRMPQSPAPHSYTTTARING